MNSTGVGVDPEDESVGIKSLGIAFAIVDAIARADGPLPLKSIAAAAGVSPSKAHRYVQTLCRMNVLSQPHRSGRYDLGPETLRIGLSAVKRVNVVNKAVEALGELAASIGADCFISVWSETGPRVVRVERAAKTTAPMIGSWTDFRLTTTATGQIFLAYAGAGATNELLLKEHGGRGLDSALLKEVHEIFAEVRKNGFAIATDQFAKGGICIAAPILSFDDRILACVTTMVLSESDHTHAAAIDAVLGFARRFSLSNSDGGEPNAIEWKIAV
ncbi:MAG: IclR family transcriptional regulator, partial [Pseudomonadota bacterium]